MEGRKGGGGGYSVIVLNPQCPHVYVKSINIKKLFSLQLAITRPGFRLPRKRYGLANLVASDETEENFFHLVRHKP